VRRKSDCHGKTAVNLRGVEVTAADTHQTFDHGQAKTGVTTTGLITQATKRPNGLIPLRRG
jgi:hypothetical protein